MKILRKILIIIISVTCITILLNIFSSRLTIKTLASGEIQRSIGRTIGVVSTFEQRKNILETNTKSIAESIRTNINYLEGLNDENEAELVNFKEKISGIEYPNVYILNKNFEIDEILKEQYDLEDDIYEINNVISEEFTSNRERGIFTGIISTSSNAYLISVKEIFDSNLEAKYVLVLERLNSDIFKDSESFAKVTEFVKVSDEELKSSRVVKINNRVIYIKFIDSNIASYVKMESYGDGEDVYVSLKEQADVLAQVQKTSMLLILAISVISIISGHILYIAIKKMVVNRILKVNTAVTQVTKTSDLKTRIEDDKGRDEISILTRDLNKMFGVLQNYSEEMKYMSEYDILTKLLNRRSIEAIGSKWIENNESFSLAFIDLDNFKLVNDSLGHNFGDEILCFIAEILKKYDDEDVRIGRLGGDEFILMSKGENNKEKVVSIIENIFNDFKHKQNIQNFTFEIKASVGINNFPENGVSMINMLQYADVAMYNVKKKSGNSYCIFDKSLLKSLEYEAKIKTGLANNEFEAYFQPICHIENGKVKGAEALVRWRSKDGIIPPDEFIPIAKKSGDIIEIDNIVLRQACELVKKYKDNGIDDFQVSINASLKLLRQNTFLEDTINIINEFGINPHNIKIEITEDETIDDMDYMINLLNNIRNAGIEVALDDFGTGYSSFNYIKTLPLDVVKIDRSLLMNLENDVRTESIIQTIIDLAHILELTVTCEGVETQKQFELLGKLKCDTVQGYYFSRPLSRGDFEEFYGKQIEN